MNTVTIKISTELQEALDALAARRHSTRSQVVRDAVQSYVLQQEAPAPGRLLDQIQDLVGCFKGGPSDLSSNPNHLAEFGQR